MKKISILLVFVGALILGGCSDDDTASTAVDNDGSETAKTVAGLVNPDLGEFPIPAPPGALREPLFISSSSIVIDYPGSELQRIVEFYDNWTASQDEDYRKFGDKAINWDNSGPQGESSTRVILVAPFEVKGKKFVAVNLGAE